MVARVTVYHIYRSFSIRRRLAEQEKEGGFSDAEKKEWDRKSKALDDLLIYVNAHETNDGGRPTPFHCLQTNLNLLNTVTR